jgi:cytoskeleton protein RodZ
MTKLGELLKSEREQKGLSLHEIGMNLKINPKILKAIEDGDPANLPAKTFLRGFVKSYAQYLKLDVNHVLQMFQEEYGSARPEPPSPTPPQAGSPTSTSSTSHPQRFENSLARPEDSALPVANNNRIYTILFAILLLTLIAFVAKMMDKYQKEARDQQSEEVAAIESVPTPLPSSSRPEGSSAGAANPQAAESSLSTAGTASSPIGASQTSITTTTTLQAVAVAPAQTTPSAPSTTSTTVRPISATAPVTPTTGATSVTTTTLAENGTTTTTTLKVPSIEVIVEALNLLTIRYSLNGGQKWETLQLNPDQVHTFRSRTSIQLEVSDGGAVNVIVNGRDRGVPGTIGKPLRLNFP